MGVDSLGNIYVYGQSSTLELAFGCELGSSLILSLFGCLGGEAVVMIGGINESEGQGAVVKTSEKWSRVHHICLFLHSSIFSHTSI